MIFELASSCSGSSVPVRPISRARTNTAGLAASTSEASIEPKPGTSSRSIILPDGNSLPVAAPPGSTKSSRTGGARAGHAGDDEIAVIRARPPSSGNVARMIFLVFVLKMRTVAVSPSARTRPSSTAKGPTAELMLPQLPL